MSYYLINSVIIILSLLIYLKLAKKYNIVDQPNHRSSHHLVTIRGGGIVFPISIILFFFTSDFVYPYFSIAIALISVVSFIDDLKPLTATLRLFFHLLSALFVIFEFLPELSLIYIPVLLFIMIGGVNAYNFMDGINGITSTYSLVILLSFLFLNQNLNFIHNNLIILPIIAVVVFSFFNFRKKAKCFSGDVGSLSIALLILFILLKLIVHTQQPLYGLMLLIYAIDTALTMLKRKMNGENILEPHRSHLYQILVNEKGYSHLMISFFYAIFQLVINTYIIFYLVKSENPFFESIFLTGLIILLYLYLKKRNK